MPIFSQRHRQCSPKPARVALGASVIKETLGLTDEETVGQIRRTPTCNTFLDIKNAPRKNSLTPPAAGGSGRADPDKTKENRGKLVMDATCVPADIRYPTDLSLLNNAWEKNEAFTDIIYEERSPSRAPTAGSPGLTTSPRSRCAGPLKSSCSRRFASSSVISAAT